MNNSTLAPRAILGDKRRRLRSRATRAAIVETEVARLLLLSLPRGQRMTPTNGKR